MDGLEPAALGRRQLRWHGEGVELAQGLLEASQREFQRRGPGRERGRSTPRRERGQRIVEHPTPVARVRHTVRGHQRKRLGRGQLVACDGGEHQALLVVRELGQRLCDGRPDGTVADRGAGLRPETPGEQQPALDPACLTAAQQRDGPGRQAIVVDQRCDEAGLIHRGQRARWCVRGQDEALVLHRRRHRLNHHGHVAMSRGLPAREAFVPVEHLVLAIAGLGHTQGQFRRGRRPVELHPSRAQRCIAGAQALHFDEEYRARRVYDVLTHRALPTHLRQGYRRVIARLTVTGVLRKAGSTDASRETHRPPRASCRVGGACAPRPRPGSRRRVRGFRSRR